ncbi:hypothetical protein ACIP4X_34410 [Streptomyces sp. NPDC088817]|uniref:hypothetical protein n=1 Tax=unclassified Streptomyces TaxID=2593676 RepID=UPI0036E08C8B
MRVAAHTKVRPDRINHHEAAHREVPAEPLGVVHDCSRGGADAGLPVVWELP